MSDAISSILSQIRAYENQARGAAGGIGGAGGLNGGAGAIGKTGGTATSDGVSFSQTLSGALKKVNQSQAEAGQLRQAFERGDPRADLARVMVAQQASSVAFRATVEVRNRLVQAYQDVMNMPL